ncbi:unnamed protein product, partial [Iphiclides podalirius]
MTDFRFLKVVRVHATTARCGISDHRLFQRRKVRNAQEWSKARQAETEGALLNALEKKNARQAARKRHRAELMVPSLQHLNFVLYWPHSTHAHPELYEKWDPHSCGQ